MSYASTDKSYSLDKPGLFAEPVNEQLVKDYRTVITKPMDFATIAEKVQNLEYDGFEDFEVITPLWYIPNY